MDNKTKENILKNDLFITWKPIIKCPDCKLEFGVYKSK